MDLYREVKAHNARWLKLFNVLEHTARTEPEQRREWLEELRRELQRGRHLWQEHLAPLFALYAETRPLAESLGRERQEVEATFARLEATDPEDKAFQRWVELLHGQARQLAAREEHELLPLAERSIPEGHVAPVAEQHAQESR